MNESGNLNEKSGEKDVKLRAKIRSDFASDDSARIQQGVAALASLIANNREPWHAINDFLDDQVGIDPEHPSAYARVYRAVFEVAPKVKNPKYLDGLRQIANIIEQNPQMIHPRHILDIAQDFYPDPRIPGFLRQGIVGSLGYALRFFEGSDYEREIGRRLDFDNKEQFNRTSRFLEIIPALYNVGDEYSYGGDTIVIKRVRKALKDAVKKQKGSYLLNVRARLLLDQMDGREFVDSNQDKRPFIIHGSQYAWHFEDGIHIASDQNSTRVKALVADLDVLEKKITPPQHLIDEAIARGENEVLWQPDQRLMAQRKNLYRELSALFIEKLEPVDIFSSSTSHQLTQEDFHDYQYLLSKPTREVVEGEFGFKLSTMSLQEQFSFLSFIKVEDALGIQEVQRFVRAYGKDGLRAFLVMEHDPEFAHEMVWTGNLLLEGVMTDGDPLFKDILAAYCRVLDGVNIARDVYRERLGRDMTEEEYEQVGAALRERATMALKRAVRSILGDTAIGADGTESVQVEKIREQLDMVEAEVIVLTSALRALNVDPRAVQGGAVVEVPSTALKGELRRQADILRVQEAQYKNKPPEFVGIVKGALQRAMKNDRTRFFMYQLDIKGVPEVAGLFRLDDVVQDGKVVRRHFASMLLNPKFEGGGIMEKVAHSTLSKEVGQVPIEAECFPTGARITEKYHEWGFVSTGMTKELGMELLKIEWDPARNALLETVTEKLDQKRVIDRAQKGAVDPRERIRYYMDDTPPAFQDYFDQKYVMTRYFTVTDKKSGALRYYAAFEKPRG